MEEIAGRGIRSAHEFRHFENTSGQVQEKNVRPHVIHTDVLHIHGEVENVRFGQVRGGVQDEVGRE